jgi:hypothetical protein
MALARFPMQNDLDHLNRRSFLRLTGTAARQRAHRRLRRMMRLFETGPSLNAIVTLSDNYDNAYCSSPAWNDAFIARRPDGQLWKSRAWIGEESYILGLAKSGCEYWLASPVAPCQASHRCGPRYGYQ